MWTITVGEKKGEKKEWPSGSKSGSCQPITIFIITIIINHHYHQRILRG